MPSGVLFIPRRMPLKLVTGPANSGKAGELLRAYRARLGDDPILVVPRLEDVEHTRAELAQAGAVLGVRVVRFAGLFELIAGTADPGLAAPPRVTRLKRELIVADAIGRASLRTMRDSAERPGFVRAAGRFVAELGRAMVDPERLRRALLEWAGDGPRRPYAEDVSGLYAAYREALERAHMVDDELFAHRALDALRRQPRRFGGSPVFVYGFDDFTPLELDAIETLARRARVDVAVSLPFEPGRVTFRATASAFAALSELADELVELPATSTHYAPEARAALSSLERRLFEEARADRPTPGAAARLHLAGGERAEVELAGAEVLSALRDGTRPGDIAVIVRDPAGSATLIEEVLDSFEIPFSLERPQPLGHTALGRGLVSLLRCAAGTGTPGDLVTYLRTPGRLRSPHLVDEFEARLRRRAIEDASAARRLWEEARWPLEEIDRIAASAGGPALLEELDGRLERLFAGPYARRAHLLAGPEREDAAVLRAARAALADLADLAGAGLGPPLEPNALADLLAEVPVPLGEAPAPDRVRVAAPEAVRARRYSTVVVLGLQEGEFPRRPASEPFLSDELRREVAMVSGLSLPVREDELDRERYLFYACVSRAERRLVLSSRVTDEEGRAEAPSFFLEDVQDVFAPGSLDAAVARRPLGDVVWPPETAPSPDERERALAARGPRANPPAPDGLHADRLLVELAARRDFSAGELETLSGCGVRWLVEKVVRPAGLAPDPEQLVRGRYAHDVLRATLERLRERTGSASVSPETLPEAEATLTEVLDELAEEHRVSPRDGRMRAARRRLERDLARHLRREADAGGVYEPTHLELEFGLGEEGADEALPALALEAEGIRVRGRIDRVDTLGDRAVVRDYKGGSSVSGVGKWKEDGRLQVPLYMLAVRELLGLEPAGGLYVPLGGRGGARGVVSAPEAEAIGGDLSRSDAREDEEIDALLAAARERVADAVERVRAGDVRPCPERCGPKGSCLHPSICREERA